jgi:hypothetical protein
VGTLQSSDPHKKIYLKRCMWARFRPTSPHLCYLKRFAYGHASVFRPPSPTQKLYLKRFTCALHYGTALFPAHFYEPHVFSEGCVCVSASPGEEEEGSIESLPFTMGLLFFLPISMEQDYWAHHHINNNTLPYRRQSGVPIVKVGLLVPPLTSSAGLLVPRPHQQQCSSVWATK